MASVQEEPRRIADAQEQAASKPLEWTDEPPIEGGLYIFAPSDGDWEMLHVATQPLTEEQQRRIPVTKHAGKVYWFGPIPVLKAVDDSPLDND